MEVKIGKPLVKTFLVLAALIAWSLLLSSSVYAQCGGGARCLSYCGDLDTDKYIYEQGEAVEFTFLNPKNYDFIMEGIYVLRLQSFTGGTSIVDAVYERTFSDPISPGTRWSWKWNQKDISGNRVQAGRFMGVIKTRYCGSYRVSFRIVPKPPKKCDPCCTFWASCRCIWHPWCS